MKNISQTIFIVIFCIAFSTFKELSFFSVFNKTIVSAALGIMGAGCGALCYFFVSKKRDWIKYLVAGIFGILIILTSAYLNRKEKMKIIENNLSAYLDSITTRQILNISIDTNNLNPPKLTPEQYSKLISCEVCGYIALCPDSTNCYNCISSKFDTTFYKVSEKMNWLRQEQLFWFSPDSKTNKIEFYEPKFENGFKKDSSWNPCITNEEVKAYNTK